jgi:hypothetical protein
MSEHLPANLADLHKAAVQAKDRVGTFRNYVALLNRGYKATEKAAKAQRAMEREFAQVREDHNFVQRHAQKVEAALVAMRLCYSNPNKVMRGLEEMLGSYPVEYVYEVCRLGIWRLGKPIGWSLLWMQSAERVAAAEIYENSVLPALAQMLPDHLDYVTLRRNKIDDLFEEGQRKVSDQRKLVAGIEANMPKWTEEMKSAAHALKPADIAALSAEEAVVHSQLMGAPLKEAPKAPENAP